MEIKTIELNGKTYEIEQSGLGRVFCIQKNGKRNELMPGAKAWWKVQKFTQGAR